MMGGPKPRTSRELCRSALAAYHELFMRLPYQDPDAGFGESYCSGMRWLEALERAAEWPISQDLIDDVDRLIATSVSHEGEALADAVILFPHEFIMVIDRRRGASQPRRDGRRMSDRATGHHAADRTPMRTSRSGLD